jgi:hypothetical protein
MTTVIFTPQQDETSKWQPIVGEFCDRYLRELKLDDSGKARILNESAQILANCMDPKSLNYSEAGLVLGFVQSGKTLSFTTITALARDNGYGLVILLAGVNNLLRVQSLVRLMTDLGVERNHEWIVRDNPGSKNISPGSAEYIDFKDRLDQWRNWQSGGKMKKPSILVTVLKHTGRVNNLANLLGALDLKDVPLLIIDDESDQASPNTKSAANLRNGLSDSSSTYEAIENLRSRAPRHTYLQYTATPQANLLAAKADALSPAFGRVITAGPDYIGGEDFFGGDRANIRVIPAADEIRGKALPDEPPTSFTESLISFWAACAITLAEAHKSGRDAPDTRSMMIQTSALTAPHARFSQWTRSIQGLWKTTLRNPDSASYPDLLEEFESAYKDLSVTFDHSVTFDEFKEWLAETLDATKVVEVNSTEDAVKDIKWYESFFWILVGGMKLDRGFTVRGITHTYMPRTVAENASTLQQRARFFGYHRKYFGLCRIHIAEPTLLAFEAYVEHEKALRLSLEKFQGKPLKLWKRSFIMDRALNKPVRSNVVGMRLNRSVISDAWISPRFMYENDDAITRNLLALDTLVKELKLLPKAQKPSGWVDKRSGSGHELYSDIPLQRVRDFLFDVQFTNSFDANLSMPLMIAIERELVKDANAAADIVLMNSLDTSNLGGRSTSDNGITNIFVGRNPAAAKSFDELNYVGDREIHTDKITLQLRLVLVNEILGVDGQMRPVPWISLKPNENLKIQVLEEME